MLLNPAKQTFIVIFVRLLMRLTQAKEKTDSFIFINN